MVSLISGSALGSHLGQQNVALDTGARRPILRGGECYKDGHREQRAQKAKAKRQALGAEGIHQKVKHAGGNLL